MPKTDLAEHVHGRTHFLESPEKRDGLDRRKVNCFINNDRRCGVACRRKERRREMERRIALRRVKFYPEYSLFE